MLAKAFKKFKERLILEQQAYMEVKSNSSGSGFDDHFEEDMKDLSRDSFGVSSKETQILYDNRNPGLSTTENNGFLIHRDDYHFMKQQMNIIRDFCYGSSAAAGWHNKPVDDGTRFMLMVSEIAEAMEGNRKNKVDDHLPHRSSEEVELADAIIRILDHCGKKGFDIGGAVAEKLHYNQTRADHKLENRALEGGKKY